MNLQGSSLSDKVVSTVAAFRAMAGSDTHCFVIVEARSYPPSGYTEKADKGPEGPRARALLVKRLYAGTAQNLSSYCTVVVGLDLGDRDAGLTAFFINDHHDDIQVTVRHSLPGSMDHPFEGVFDLRRLEITAPRQDPRVGAGIGRPTEPSLRTTTLTRTPVTPTRPAVVPTRTTVAPTRSAEPLTGTTPAPTRTTVAPTRTTEPSTGTKPTPALPPDRKVELP